MLSATFDDQGEAADPDFSVNLTMVTRDSTAIFRTP